MQKKNYYLAIKYLNKAFNQDKTSYNLLTNLSVCYINLFNNKKAIQNSKILKKQFIDAKVFHLINYFI